MKKSLSSFVICFLFAACSEPPKPQIPSLTPEVANQVLHYNTNAENWLVHARKQDPSCVYQLDIPDQNNQTTQLDFKHIMKCGGRVSPLELDAAVTFQYDPDAKRWVISRFSN